MNAGVFLVAAYYSPENVMNTNPRRVMYAFGFQFILMTLRVQLSGVTHEKFNPFRRTTLLTWAVLISHLVHVYIYGTPFMNEATMYLVIDIMSFASLAHFFINVTTELTTILGINLLTLTTRQLALQPALKLAELKEEQRLAEEGPSENSSKTKAH